MFLDPDKQKFVETLWITLFFGLLEEFGLAQSTADNLPIQNKDVGGT